MDSLVDLILIVVLVWSATFFSSHYVSFAVGDSMEPTFLGCALLAINTDSLPQDLASGEVVVVELDEPQNGFDRIVHRVVENLPGEEKFSTRGDNDVYYDFPSSIDGYFPYSAFRGKVAHYINLPLEACNDMGGEDTE